MWVFVLFFPVVSHSLFQRESWYAQISMASGGNDDAEKASLSHHEGTTNRLFISTI